MRTPRYFGGAGLPPGLAKNTRAGANEMVQTLKPRRPVLRIVRRFITLAALVLAAHAI
jgi:hypothetical protein